MKHGEGGAIDRAKAFKAAKRWAGRARGAKDDADRMRIWRQTIANLKAFLTGKPSDPHPEQRKLLT